MITRGNVSYNLYNYLVFLVEIRMLMSYLKGFSLECYTIITRHLSKICFRCKDDQSSVNAVCLNCKKAIYCTKKCMVKNSILHDYVCKYYIEKENSIKMFIEKFGENYKSYKQHREVVDLVREHDDNIS